MNKEESSIKEARENLEKSKTTAKAQEVSKDTRKKSPESTSSEPQKKAGNRKSTREVRIRVIRLVTANGEEVTPPSEEQREVVDGPQRS